MRYLNAFSFFVACLLATRAFGADALPATSTIDAIKALRQGGYVVVMIPGDTEKDDGEGIKPALSLGNCSSQATLSDYGRMSASAFGRLMHREHIRVASLYSSRFCRGVETAERIAEQVHLKKVVQLDELGEANSPVTTVSAERRTEVLRRLASSQPARGANAVVVTHRPNVAEAFGTELANLADGEMAIFKPAPGKQYALVYRVKVVDLSAYLREQKTAQSPKT